MVLNSSEPIDIQLESFKESINFYLNVGCPVKTIKLERNDKCMNADY